MRNTDSEPTLVSFFSGGGGFDIGALMAGFKPIRGYEYIPKIALSYGRNLGWHVRIKDILDLDENKIPWANLYHFSPPCPNFSNAKLGRGETEHDIALGRKIASIIRAKLPDFVTLENVYGYRKSFSILIIYYTLLELGYSVDWWHLNSANFGVPQTRMRLILVARKDGAQVRRPKATHEKDSGSDQLAFGFFKKKKWVGWYEAIEDLIDGLEDSQFAPWQLEKLPDWFKFQRTALMEQSVGGDRKAMMFEKDEPTATLRTGSGGRVARAFIANGETNNNGQDMTTLGEDDPLFTIKASAYKRPLRAFIMNAANPNGNEKKKYREGDQPMKTITSGDSLGIKGYVPHSNAGSRSDGVDDSSPMYTIGAGKVPEKAWISYEHDIWDCGSCGEIFAVDETPTECRKCGSDDVGVMWMKGENFIIPGGNANSAMPRGGNEPAQTVSDTKRTGNYPRGYADGRVVKLSIRALARLQSFPDWYQFPLRKSKGGMVLDKTTSCTIIGNSVPPLLAKAICESLLL